MGGKRKLNAEKFYIISIFKIELQVLGIQPELAHGLARLIGHAVGRGRLGPAIFPVRMLKLQIAAVLEKEHSLVEFCVDHVARNLRVNCVSQIVHGIPHIISDILA